MVVLDVLDHRIPLLKGDNMFDHSLLLRGQLSRLT